MRLSAVVALSALTRHQVGPRVTPFGSLKMHPPRGWLLRGEGHEGPARCWWHARVRGVGGCPSQPLFPPPPPLRRAAPHRARVCACAAASGRGLRTPVVRSRKVASAGNGCAQRVAGAARGGEHPVTHPAVKHAGRRAAAPPPAGESPPFLLLVSFHASAAYVPRLRRRRGSPPTRRSPRTSVTSWTQSQSSARAPRRRPHARPHATQSCLLDWQKCALDFFLSADFIFNHLHSVPVCGVVDPACPPRLGLPECSGRLTCSC